VADVKYPHPVLKPPVKYQVRISDEWNGVHARTLPDLRRCFRVFGNMRDDPLNTRLDGCGNGFAKHMAVSGYLAEVGNRAVRVFDPHARRNEANAASTCSGVATPL
jgi:hypothetical protein